MRLGGMVGSGSFVSFFSSWSPGTALTTQVLLPLYNNTRLTPFAKKATTCSLNQLNPKIASKASIFKIVNVSRFFQAPREIGKLVANLQVVIVPFAVSTQIGVTFSSHWMSNSPVNFSDK
ncbi:hypothetical protein O6H91_05G089500 [Diphasiastrum complanatum]|uniref:Uncharacterized protein n=1 Tax=Diphasiastrum complanatum TaxID=34168 RepID=A0ACC2DQQ8_DIPCM|nr:hypothetical protein O6H91_05G089500 [Diphasiastrum complanatum]